MIDYEDFRGMCERVARVTGRIDEETRKVYFEALKDHDRDTVFRAMRKVGKDHPFYKFPTIAEILDAVRDCQEPHRPTPIFCDKCNMTGFILVEKKGYSTAYRCSCENGRKISKTIRSYELVRSEYEPEDAPPIPIVPLEGLEYLEAERVFENGVAVEKVCDRCWTKYQYEHVGKQTVHGLRAFHKQVKSVCSACYVEEGKEKGLWK